MNTFYTINFLLYLLLTSSLLGAKIIPRRSENHFAYPIFNFDYTSMIELTDEIPVFKFEDTPIIELTDEIYGSNICIDPKFYLHLVLQNGSVKVDIPLFVKFF